jgi:hypothetical protein
MATRRRPSEQAAIGVSSSVTDEPVCFYKGRPGVLQARQSVMSHQSGEMSGKTVLSPLLTEPHISSSVTYGRVSKLASFVTPDFADF